MATGKALYRGLIPSLLFPGAPLLVLETLPRNSIGAKYKWLPNSIKLNSGNVYPNVIQVSATNFRRFTKSQKQLIQTLFFYTSL